MIVITVTSDIMEVTRRFRKDRPSITFLKNIKRIHQSVAEYNAGLKPSGIKARRTYRQKVEENAIPVKINITHIN